MLFNSNIFIFGFLPTCLIGYYGLARLHRESAKLFLLFASFAFYGWSNLEYVPLLASSIGFNYLVGGRIQTCFLKGYTRSATAWCSFGVLANLGLLVYFKYTNFLIDNVNIALGTDFTLRYIILPLGISFYSFQRIAYLIDCARGEIKQSNLLGFSLFAVFFPQLISGPIVRYNEIYPQFQKQPFILGVKYNLLVGVVIFTIGMAKKTFIADPTGYLANELFDAASHGAVFDILNGWLAALSFTIQVYFDFSGYSDMAIGLGRMFGILLPLNFHSPLRATSIVEYWRRWHMTLQRFMVSYFYQPLSLILTRGAADYRLGRWPNFIISVAVPAFITFVIIGIWHGAGWTFVLFGVMHAAYVCTNEAWRELRRHQRRRLKKATSRSNIVSRGLSIVITLACVLVANVLFRADRVATAVVIYKGMFGLSKTSDAGNLLVTKPQLLIFLALGFLITTIMPNTQQIMRAYRPALNWPQWRNVALSVVTWHWRPNAFGIAVTGLLLAMVIAVNLMWMSREQAQFIYFQF